MTDQGYFERIVAEGVEAAARAPADPPDLRGYVEMALAGSFPSPVLHLQGPARRRWLGGYLDQILTRDASRVTGDRDPVRLRRYLEALAPNTAGVVEDKTLCDAARINARTAAAYDRLLTNLFVVEAVPAWMTDRLKRLARSPKRYVVDPGLVGVALRVDTDGVMRDGDLLGRVLDSFVMAQVRGEISVRASRLRAYHLRQQQGRHEVDVVLEAADGRVIGVEVKAEAAPTVRAARGISLGFATSSETASSPASFCTPDRVLTCWEIGCRRSPSARCGVRREGVVRSRPCATIPPACPRSSVDEHRFPKPGVAGSIPAGGTKSLAGLSLPTSNGGP